MINRFQLSALLDFSDNVSIKDDECDESEHYAELNKLGLVSRDTGGFSKASKLGLEVIRKCESIANLMIERLTGSDGSENWVYVPWQDVQFLFSQGVKLKWKISSDSDFKEMDSINPAGKFHWFSYIADMRTFPVGYSPVEPRWVQAQPSQLDRLSSSGCQLATRITNWESPSGFKSATDYVVDAHTMKPEVELYTLPNSVPTPQ